MPHTCALAVSKNALKIGMDAFCAVVSTSTQTNTNHNPPKLEVPFPNTGVMLTCSVHDNLLHGCTPLMFGVCSLF